LTLSDIEEEFKHKGMISYNATVWLIRRMREYESKKTPEEEDQKASVEETPTG